MGIKIVGAGGLKRYLLPYSPYSREKELATSEMALECWRISLTTRGRLMLGEVEGGCWAMSVALTAGGRSVRLSVARAWRALPLRGAVPLSLGAVGSERGGASCAFLALELSLRRFLGATTVVFGAFDRPARRVEVRGVKADLPVVTSGWPARRVEVRGVKAELPVVTTGWKIMVLVDLFCSIVPRAAATPALSSEGLGETGQGMLAGSPHASEAMRVGFDDDLVVDTRSAMDGGERGERGCTLFSGDILMLVSCGDLEKVENEAQG